MTGKTTVETAVKSRREPRSTAPPAVRYTNENGKAVISEIRIGGTATRLIFN